jgi:hypothetical protein
MTKGRWITYSQAELAWLRENHLLPAPQLHAGFVAAFGRHDISKHNLISKRKRMGLMTGRDGRFAPSATPHNKGRPHPARGRAAQTQFRKGNVPHTVKWLGHERLCKNGYIEVSVAEPSPYTGFERRYVQKHRWLWEQLNGPVPQGMALKSLDGNRTNCDPANWVVIPRALLPRLNGGRHKRRIAYDTAPPELKPTVMALAKLEQAAKDARDRAGTRSKEKERAS